MNASALATLVGTWIWEALLRRDLLAIPRDVFKLLEKADGRTVRWWRMARQEVCTMAEAVDAGRSEPPDSARDVRH